MQPMHMARRATTETFTVGSVPSVRTAATQPTKIHPPMIPVIAEISGSIQGAFGCLAAAIGVGLVGAKAVEGVGRNPGASGKILVQSIIGMALAEAVAFYALFLGK